MASDDSFQNRRLPDAFPTWPEIRDRVERFVEKNREIARIETIGRSAEGRKICAVFVTDNAQSVHKKEIVLIVMGRHGDELGTRTVGLRLLEWLSSPQARDILVHQQIVLVPVVNPDGCAKDLFGLPGDRLSSLEKESVARVGLSLVPDVVIDVHSVGKEKYGYNWGGLEAVIIDEAARSGEDPYILHTLADKMIQGAARKGYPFLLHPIGFYRGLKKRAATLSEGAFNNHLNQVFYDACHALTFGIEVNHFVLCPEEAAESGMAAIAALLETGHSVFPWEYYPGYPNRILRGEFTASIRPRGETATERRASRQEIWTRRHFFGSVAPYRRMDNDHSVNLAFTYSGKKPLQGGLTVALRLRGRPRIGRIEVNGTLNPHTVATDACSTHLFIDIETIGLGVQNKILVEF